MHNVVAINAAARQSIMSAQAVSDEMLLGSIADGNRTAMHILYARHHVRVYRFILRIVRDDALPELDLDLASALVYFPDTADYLLLDRRHPLYFCDDQPDPARRRRIEALLAQAGIDRPAGTVDYGSLYAGASPLDDEIFTWLISVPGLSFDVLERAWPIVAYLRGVRGPALFERMVANTRTGIAHFHEIPGEGTLDLAASFKALNAHGFDGFGSVELYHHVESWQQALDDSYRHLAAIAQPA